jgi:hypothetical protein
LETAVVGFSEDFQVPIKMWTGMAASAGRAKALSSTGAALEPLIKSLYVNRAREILPEPVHNLSKTILGGKVAIGP